MIPAIQSSSIFYVFSNIKENKFPIGISLTSFVIGIIGGLVIGYSIGIGWGFGFGSTTLLIGEVSAFYFKKRGQIVLENKRFSLPTLNPDLLSTDAIERFSELDTEEPELASLPEIPPEELACILAVRLGIEEGNFHLVNDGRFGVNGFEFSVNPNDRDLIMFYFDSGMLPQPDWKIEIKLGNPISFGFLASFFDPISQSFKKPCPGSTAPTHQIPGFLGGTHAEGTFENTHCIKAPKTQTISHKGLHCFLCAYGNRLELLDLTGVLTGWSEQEKGTLFRLIPLLCPSLKLLKFD